MSPYPLPPPPPPESGSGADGGVDDDVSFPFNARHPAVGEATRIAKEVLNFFFSYYGICAGKSDGCLKSQVAMAELVGKLEANALSGGMLKEMGVLKEKPLPTVESMITTVPPCYCSPAFNYSKIVDTYTDWVLNGPEAAPHASNEPTTIVTGFMSTSGMCLSDQCKDMMDGIFYFFTNITVQGTEEKTCKPANVLNCVGGPDSLGCVAPPTQDAWLGTVADQVGDTWKTDKKMPDDWWKHVYWSACSVKQYCPDKGVSAYLIETKLVVAADKVDTEPKRERLKTKFVAMVNKEAKARVLENYMVEIRLDSPSARRGRALSTTTVTFVIETTSELAKNQVNTIATDSTTFNAAKLSTELFGDTTSVTGTFTETEITTLVYPPPPPAPGYKDGLTQEDQLSEETIIIIVVCVLVGCCCCVLVAVASVLILKKKNQKKGGGGGGGFQAGNSAGVQLGGAKKVAGKV